MCEYEFKYVVSGIELSESERLRISEAIAITVAHALAGEFPEPLPSNFHSNHPACGGLDASSRSDNAPMQDAETQEAYHSTATSAPTTSQYRAAE